jgi:hypothetical protein
MWVHDGIPDDHVLVCARNEIKGRPTHLHKQVSFKVDAIGVRPTPSASIRQLPCSAVM